MDAAEAVGPALVEVEGHGCRLRWQLRPLLEETAKWADQLAGLVLAEEPLRESRG